MTNPSLEHLSNWTRFRPSLCRNCQAGCCQLPVEAKAADLIRLGVLSEDEAEGSLKKAARRLIASGVVQRFRASTGTFTLAQTLKGDCIFLGPESRLCTRYDQRPSVCRRFPEISPRPGYCPAYSKPKR